MPFRPSGTETDCPYLAPVPNRGKRNSSLNLTYVADQLAAIKGIDRETVEKITRIMPEGFMFTAIVFLLTACSNSVSEGVKIPFAPTLNDRNIT